MPDVTAFYKLKMNLRRWPALHRPLQKSRRLLTEKIPKTAVDLWRAVTPRNSFRLGPPNETISIYQSLLYEKMRPARVVLTDQGAPELSADSLMAVSGLRQHLCQPWPVFWSHHKNARLVSSSLALLDERKRLCRESVYNDMCAQDDPAWNYFALPKAVSLAGNWTSIVSRWCPNTGAAPFSHWIMDALPRLALLKEFPADTKIIVPSRLAGYQKEMLKMLGLMDRVRPTPEKHLILENYYFSSPTSMISCYSPYSIRWLREAFLPHADKSYNAPKRFVIQRKGKSRGILNEDEVNAYFQKLGWAIIDTETLTFAQELQLFSNAEAVAGIFGSGFTNCIWSPPGCKVITFIPDSFIDGGVESHTVVNKIDYFWQIFPSDHAMMATVDVGEIKKLLRKAGLEAD
ncbi:MAG TPA: glycosyltransferase family 61 protein [Verrucomicrobiae bacterium]|nr:glycosyltransferase family 61 protein [Verrucomicrobiae bacterium]